MDGIGSLEACARSFDAGTTNAGRASKRTRRRGDACSSPEALGLIEDADDTPPTDERLFAIVVTDTQVIVKKNLTFTQADEELLKLNIEGDMSILEQT